MLSIVLKKKETTHLQHLDASLLVFNELDFSYRSLITHWGKLLSSKWLHLFGNKVLFISFTIKITLKECSFVFVEQVVLKNLRLEAYSVALSRTSEIII